MTAPRRILPGQFYLVTRRTLLRMFLLRPHPSINAMFEYCIAEAAARFEIDVIAWCAMSNHYHAVIYDRDRRVPAFIEHFHKMFAKAVNVHHKRFESVWSRDQTCLTRLVTLQDVFDKVVYVLSNPASAHLVDDIVQWPGASSWNRMGRPAMPAQRPKQYFCDDGRMPEEAELRVVAPPGLKGESYAEWIKRVQAAVIKRQKRLAEERLQTGRGVLGRKRVLRTDPFGTPTTETPRRKLQPHLACKDKARMKAERLELKRFRADYREMRRRLRVGEERIEFPDGTYRLRLLGLCCKSCDGPPDTPKPGLAKPAKPAKPANASRRAA